MRVLDASVVTDAVVVDGPPGENARRLLEDERVLHTPAMLGAEVTSALRAMVLRGSLLPVDARAAALHDGWYVALAESLEVPLITGDERLRAAPGPRCRVLTPAEAVGER